MAVPITLSSVYWPIIWVVLVGAAAVVVALTLLVATSSRHHHRRPRHAAGQPGTAPLPSQDAAPDRHALV